MAGRTAHVEFYVDKLGDHRWRSIANGRIVADSAEGYANASDCRAGAIAAGVIDDDDTVTDGQ